MTIGHTTARPSFARRAGRQLYVIGVTATVTLIGYLALLGWVRGKNVWAYGAYTQPYASWQIAILLLVLAVTAAWAGARDAGVAGAVAAAVTMTVCYGIDASTEASDDGLWAVGALGILVVTFFACWLVAILYAAWRQRFLRRTGPRQPTIGS